MSNYIEGKIVGWSLGGAFLFSGLLFVGKIVAAILAAIEQKVNAIDAWMMEHLDFIQKLTDFIDRGRVNFIGKELVGLGF